MKKAGILGVGQKGCGTMTLSERGIRIPCEYEIETHQRGGLFRMEYQGIKLEIQLSTRVPNFGGRQWWLQCPKCMKDFQLLYFPPGQREFRCRDCYNLGYRSTLTQRKRITRIIKSVNSVDEIFDRQEPDEILLEAARQFVKRKKKRKGGGRNEK